jgi:dUTP pyrophosphatase
MSENRLEDAKQVIETIEQNMEYIRASLLKIKENEEMKNVVVFVEKLSDDVVLPVYAKKGDAGMDVRATKDIVILPNETVIVPTGLKVAIPEGYEIQIRPRSGLSFKTPLRVANAPGTIDSGYRDEIGVIMTNTRSTETFDIKKGDRIAQFVLSEVPKIKWVLTLDIEEIGINRNGGFGSTGSE